MEISPFKLNRFNGKNAWFYKLLAKFICAFIPFRNTRRVVKKYIKYGDEYYQSRKAVKMYCNYNDFENYLNLVACLKNEADYIVEWIEYYKLMGVEHFYLYNNNSTDNIHDVIKPYIEKGLVTFIDYPGIKKQNEIYTRALIDFRLKSKWLIVVDLDEFILPKKHETIVDFLKDNEEYGQVLIEWYVFGDSGHKTKPKGLVIENFLYRDHKGWGLTKAIIQPTRTFEVKEHSSDTLKSKKIPIEDVQCNHYFTKSEEEYYTKKSPRKDNSGIDKYTKEMFEAHNRNDIPDQSMLAYVEKIKKILASETNKN